MPKLLPYLMSYVLFQFLLSINSLSCFFLIFSIPFYFFDGIVMYWGQLDYPQEKILQLKKLMLLLKRSFDVLKNYLLNPLLLIPLKVNFFFFNSMLLFYISFILQG